MSLSNQASNQIFDCIADRYDLVNNILSFGLHSSWRLRLTGSLPATASSVLDIACGTLSIPLTLLRERTNISKIVGIDISERMLSIGQKRLKMVQRSRSIQLVKGDALVLPFRNSSFNVVTIGFALRNVPDIMRLISSAYRVLGSNGSFGILEFSTPRGFLGLLHKIYLIMVMPLMGYIFTGNSSAYQHLGNSILQFPPSDRFIRMLQQAGFKNITMQPLAFGAVTLYMAKK